MRVIRASLQHSKMHLVSHRTGREQDLIWFLLLSARFTSSPSDFLLATRSPRFLAHQSNQIEAMRERICHFHIFLAKIKVSEIEVGWLIGMIDCLSLGQTGWSRWKWPNHVAKELLQRKIEFWVRRSRVRILASARIFPHRTNNKI